jgi:hypothetical protein
MLGKAFETARLASCPDISPLGASVSAFKEWLEIYKTLAPLPENSFYQLGGINAKAVELFQGAGITSIDDIPESLEVSKTINNQLRAYRNNGPIIDQTEDQTVP